MPLWQESPEGLGVFSLLIGGTRANSESDPLFFVCFTTIRAGGERFSGIVFQSLLLLSVHFWLSTFGKQQQQQQLFPTPLPLPPPPRQSPHPS